MAEPASEHPDLVTLTDLADDGLTGTELTEVRAHVDRCPLCQDNIRRLADVRRSLADLGTGPELRMPTDVAESVRASLAAAAAGPDRTVASLPAAARRRRVPTAGLVAASVVVLLVLVIGGGLLLRPGTGSSPTSGSGGGDAGAPALATPGTATPGTATPARTLLTASGRDYTPSSLGADVRGLLGGTPPTADSGGGPAPDRAGGDGTDDPLRTLRTAAGLASCLQTLTGGSGASPLAVDYARWRGQPAAVIVLPGTGSDTVTVYVASPDCGPTSTSVLYYAQLPR